MSRNRFSVGHNKPRSLPGSFALSGGTIPLPRRHEESPPPKDIVTFPARVEHDGLCRAQLQDRLDRLECDLDTETNELRVRALNVEYRDVRRQLDALSDPDPMPSDRIVPHDDHQFEHGGPKLPTTSETSDPALVASLIHGALVQLLETETPLEQIAQVIAGAIRLEAERIAERERDKALVAVRQLGDVVTVLVEALEQHSAPNGAA